MVSSLCFLWLLALLPADSATAQFKIQTTQPGFYRLSFDRLQQAGGDAQPVPLEKLAIHFQGKPVRFHVDDLDRDGAFGPGESMLFRSDRLAGENAYYHEYSDYSMHILTIGGEPGLPMRQIERASLVTDDVPVSEYRGLFRTEEEVLNMRFPSGRSDAHEIWYWQKLSCIDEEPFRFKFDLPDSQNTSAEEAEIRIGLRGFSTLRIRPEDGGKDHQLAVILNGNEIGRPAWNGRDENELRLSFPQAWLKPVENELVLQIPVRQYANGHTLVDVSVLNWIDFRYTRNGLIPADQQSHFYLKDGHGNHVTFQTDATDLHLVWEDGVVQHMKREGDGPVKLTARVGKSHRNLWAIPAGTIWSPTSVTRMNPDDLRQAENQADYLMVVHPSLAEAIKPLADFHRQRGLKVKLVDVFDVYDHFNHAIPHPDAIQSFLAYTHESWQKPAPRFVLLVGDASWDFRHTQAETENYVDDTRARMRDQFIHIPFTEYEGTPEARGRNLIPSYRYFNYSGHSASDNRFVAFGGPDEHRFRPQMAIGRLPLVTPEEVTSVVQKTIAYMKQPPIGPWRRNVLWITNEEASLQRITERVASEISEKGWTATKIYPRPEEKDNVANTQSISEALATGQNLVYFFGHGGRFIWRTGPPDYQKNHDLFTLEDLDKLEATPRQPVVVSFTCFSAPFDHPSADSIGEKFLRLPDKGAVAFIGASWRNSPGLPWIRGLMTALTEEKTVGEAMWKAKQDINNPTFLETYNLMGDPALPLLLPPGALDLMVKRQSDDDWKVTIVLPSADFQGQGMIDLVDEGGVPIFSKPFEVDDSKIKVILPAHAEGQPVPVAVTAYVWNEETNKDAMGRINLPPSATTAQQDPVTSPGEPGNDRLD